MSTGYLKCDPAPATATATPVTDSDIRDLEARTQLLATRVLLRGRISDGRQPTGRPLPGDPATIIHAPRRRCVVWCHTCRCDVTGRSANHTRYGHSVTVEL